MPKRYAEAARRNHAGDFSSARLKNKPSGLFFNLLPLFFFLAISFNSHTVDKTLWFLDILLFHFPAHLFFLNIKVYRLFHFHIQKLLQYCLYPLILFPAYHHLIVKAPVDYFYSHTLFDNQKSLCMGIPDIRCGKKHDAPYSTLRKDNPCRVQICYLIGPFSVPFVLHKITF